MNQFMFSGSGVALVTPFKNGKVDFETLEQLIEWQIVQGMDFLVCLGTTGEAITLSPQECNDIKDTFVRVNRGRLPLVYGVFGGNNTYNILHRLDTLNMNGVDGILSSSPNYNKPTQEGIFLHYKSIADKSKWPIIIYNVPSRTASNVAAATTVSLANYSDKFVAVKEASGDLNQVMKILKDKPERFQVLSGDDPLTLPMMFMGAVGCISVIGNLYPKEWTKMIHLASKNPMKAKAINDAIMDLHPWIYCEGNPSGIKAAMHFKGIASNEVRLPLVPYSECNTTPINRQVELTDKNLFSLLDDIA